MFVAAKVIDVTVNNQTIGIQRIGFELVSPHNLPTTSQGVVGCESDG
jgi:hypothetical protein